MVSSQTQVFAGVTFILNKSEPKSYKQIGNAIPPVLMWYVANELSKVVGETEVEQVKYYAPIELEIQFACEGGVTYRAKSKS